MTSKFANMGGGECLLEFYRNCFFRRWHHHLLCNINITFLCTNNSTPI